MFEFANVKMTGRKEQVMTTRPLRAGYLEKRGAINKNWKRRYVEEKDFFFFFFFFFLIEKERSSSQP